MTCEPGRGRRLPRRAALVRLAGLGLAGAALATACQQPTSPNRASEARPPAPTLIPFPTPTVAATARPGAPAVTPTPVPRLGGALTWAVDADPGDLDPYANPSPAAVPAWGDLVYQGLVAYDAQMKLVPALAESWVTTSPTSWTFRLRRGVRFHDGSEFEAEDVRAWFQRLAAPTTAAPYRAAFRHIAKVEPRGRNELTFTLAEPYAPFLATLAALRGSAIAPRAWLDGAGRAGPATAVGSGPFRVAEYVPGSHLTYQRHDGYWEKPLPYLDSVTVRFMPEAEARIAAVRGGQVHGATVGPAAAQRLAAERGLATVSAPGATQQMTVLNLRREPFDDLRVRQALALAVDRAAAITRVAGGEARLTGPLPTPPDSRPIPADGLPSQRNLALARRLLGEAGRPDGFQATVRTAADDPIMLGLATVLAEQLRPLGVAVTVERLSAGALAAAYRARDFDLISHSAGFLPDPAAYLAAYYLPNGELNGSGLQRPRLDDLAAAARAVLDPGQRGALYDEAAALLLDDAPHIWWFAENRLQVVPADASAVRGVLPSYDGRRSFLKTAWLDG